ncbi:MAG: riboflavin biosynthesis protein RibF [Elusimicrobia bacterium]|nr:riboflavin biosynthesis protein RibF [Elusimicrobiota bacterium]
MRSSEIKKIIAIGTFDGVHRGHQKLLARLRGIAARHRALAGIAVFPYAPRLFLNGQIESVRLLTTLQERLRILRDECGLDEIHVLPMNWKLFRLEASEFLDRIIRRRWKAQMVVFGENFALGAGRKCHSGNFGSFAEPLGLRWQCVSLKESRLTPVSSTRIRALLAEGNLKEANKLLGRPYEVSGAVVRGNRLAGPALGFPTANLKVFSMKLLPLGVFEAYVPQFKRMAVVNIGFRPTVMKRQEHPLVEAHILDFHGRLYGRELTLQLSRRLRPEERFFSLSELRARIAGDIRRVRAHAIMEKAKC